MEAGTTEPKKKKRRKRRQRPDQGRQYDTLCVVMTLLQQLRIVLEDADAPRVSSGVDALVRAVQTKLLANPGMLFARLASVSLQNGHAKPEITLAVRPPAQSLKIVPEESEQEPRVRTVGGESPVLSLGDIDLFLQEETPGRYFEYQLGPRTVPILQLGREEYVALRNDLAASAGDLEEFKRDLAKTVPDDLLAPFCRQIMGVYRGCAIKV